MMEEPFTEREKDQTMMGGRDGASLQDHPTNETNNNNDSNNNNNSYDSTCQYACASPQDSISRFTLASVVPSFQS